MPDTKISADPEATDLTGAVFAIVQGGTNKKAPSTLVVHSGNVIPAPFASGAEVITGTEAAKFINPDGLGDAQGVTAITSSTNTLTVNFANTLRNSHLMTEHTTLQASGWPSKFAVLHVKTGGTGYTLSLQADVNIWGDLTMFPYAIPANTRVDFTLSTAIINSVTHLDIAISGERQVVVS